MTTFLAKRKGMSFFRMTTNGKTIKDFKHKNLKQLLRNAGYKQAAKIREKSLLWKKCIDFRLL